MLREYHLRCLDPELVNFITTSVIYTDKITSFIIDDAVFDFITKVDKTFAKLLVAAGVNIWRGRETMPKTLEEFESSGINIQTILIQRTNDKLIFQWHPPHNSVMFESKTPKPEAPKEGVECGDGTPEEDPKPDLNNLTSFGYIDKFVVCDNNGDGDSLATLISNELGDYSVKIETDFLTPDDFDTIRDASIMLSSMMQK